jgi:hypothetical protein
MHGVLWQFFLNALGYQLIKLDVWLIVFRQSNGLLRSLHDKSNKSDFETA